MIAFFSLCVLVGFVAPSNFGIFDSKYFSPVQEKKPDKEFSEHSLYPSHLSPKIFSGRSFSKVEDVSGTGGIIVKCGEKNWRIIVKKEYFGRGIPFSPQFVRLGVDESDGQCVPLSDFLTASEIIISAGLQDCGSESRIIGDWLIYSNKLVFSPGPLLSSDGVVIFRRAPTVVAIECHYKRKFRVSGEPLSPTWLPMTSTIEAAGLMHFSFHIIKDVNGSLRQSTVFQQGEPLLLEAAVHAPMHPPLRIYIDYCVATANSDPLSKPSYEFISKHGCLVDSMLPNSSSQFYRRPKANVLRFGIQSFNFPQDLRKQIFITCHLKVVPHHNPSDFQNKACYFHWPAFRWHAIDGSHFVCLCCETKDCHSDTAVEKKKEKQASVGVGPLTFLPTKSHWTGQLTLGDISLT